MKENNLPIWDNSQDHLIDLSKNVIWDFKLECFVDNEDNRFLFDNQQQEWFYFCPFCQAGIRDLINSFDGSELLYGRN